MSYICKIANKEEILKQFDYEISIHPDELENWTKWKEECANRPDGQRITYFGILDGEVICETTAGITKESIQNADGLVDNNTAYLFAFRTKEKFRHQGYFSILFKYMINDLKQRGFTKVTLGVEPDELDNKAIYFHYGFNEHIKDDIEIEPDGTEVEVEYYGRNL